MNTKRFIVLYVDIDNDEETPVVKTSKKVDKSEAKRIIDEHHGYGKEYSIGSDDPQGRKVFQTYSQFILSVYGPRIMRAKKIKEEKNLTDIEPCIAPSPVKKKIQKTEEELCHEYGELYDLGKSRGLYADITREIESCIDSLPVKKKIQKTEEELRHEYGELYDFGKSRGLYVGITRDQYIQYRLTGVYNTGKQSKARPDRHPTDVLTINLEKGKPFVNVTDAMTQIDIGLMGNKYKYAAIRIIHGKGHEIEGRIRIATHEKLKELKERKMIRDYIFGEDYHKYNSATYNAILRIPKLDEYYQYDSGNEGISIVLL